MDHLSLYNNNTSKNMDDSMGRLFEEEKAPILRADRDIVKDIQNPYVSDELHLPPINSTVTITKYRINLPICCSETKKGIFLQTKAK